MQQGKSAKVFPRGLLAQKQGDKPAWKYRDSKRYCGYHQHLENANLGPPHQAYRLNVNQICVFLEDLGIYAEFIDSNGCFFFLWANFLDRGFSIKGRLDYRLYYSFLLQS